MMQHIGRKQAEAVMPVRRRQLRSVYKSLLPDSFELVKGYDEFVRMLANSTSDKNLTAVHDFSEVLEYLGRRPDNIAAFCVSCVQFTAASSQVDDVTRCFEYLVLDHRHFRSAFEPAVTCLPLQDAMWLLAHGQRLSNVDVMDHADMAAYSPASSEMCFASRLLRTTDLRDIGVTTLESLRYLLRIVDNTSTETLAFDQLFSLVKRFKPLYDALKTVATHRGDMALENPVSLHLGLRPAELTLNNLGVQQEMTPGMYFALFCRGLDVDHMTNVGGCPAVSHPCKLTWHFRAMVLASLATNIDPATGAWNDKRSAARLYLCVRDPSILVFAAMGKFQSTAFLARNMFSKATSSTKEFSEWVGRLCEHADAGSSRVLLSTDVVMSHMVTHVFRDLFQPYTTPINVVVAVSLLMFSELYRKMSPRFITTYLTVLTVLMSYYQSSTPSNTLSILDMTKRLRHIQISRLESKTDRQQNLDTAFTSADVAMNNFLSGVCRRFQPEAAAKGAAKTAKKTVPKKTAKKTVPKTVPKKTATTVPKTANVDLPFSINRFVRCMLQGTLAVVTTTTNDGYTSFVFCPVKAPDTGCTTPDAAPSAAPSAVESLERDACQQSNTCPRLDVCQWSVACPQTVNLVDTAVKDTILMIAYRIIKAEHAIVDEVATTAATTTTTAGALVLEIAQRTSSFRRGLENEFVSPVAAAIEQSIRQQQFSEFCAAGTSTTTARAIIQQLAKVLPKSTLNRDCRKNQLRCAEEICTSMQVNIHMTAAPARVFVLDERQTPAVTSMPQKLFTIPGLLSDLYVVAASDRDTQPVYLEYTQALLRAWVAGQTPSCGEMRNVKNSFDALCRKLQFGSEFIAFFNLLDDFVNTGSAILQQRWQPVTTTFMRTVFYDAVVLCDSHEDHAQDSSRLAMSIWSFLVTNIIAGICHDVGALYVTRGIQDVELATALISFDRLAQCSWYMLNVAPLLPTSLCSLYAIFMAAAGVYPSCPLFSSAFLNKEFAQTVLLDAQDRVQPGPLCVAATFVVLKQRTCGEGDVTEHGVAELGVTENDTTGVAQAECCTADLAECVNAIRAASKVEASKAEASKAEADADMTLSQLLFQQSMHLVQSYKKVVYVEHEEQDQEEEEEEEEEEERSAMTAGNADDQDQDSAAFEDYTSEYCTCAANEDFVRSFVDGLVEKRDTCPAIGDGVFEHVADCWISDVLRHVVDPLKPGHVFNGTTITEAEWTVDMFVKTAKAAGCWDTRSLPILQCMYTHKMTSFSLCAHCGCLSRLWTMLKPSLEMCNFWNLPRGEPAHPDVCWVCYDKWSAKEKAVQLSGGERVM